MKRYRLICLDFDTRASILQQGISDHWEEHAKQLHLKNRERIIESIRVEFGEQSLDAKVRNLTDLAPLPLSVIAFHNAFYRQCWHSFVLCSYYPALTGACALGERILNHLMILLRDDFKSSPEYKHIYRKDSFDRWETPIGTLESWMVFRPETAAKFRELMDVRNNAIHFHPEIDRNDRELALKALRLLGDILTLQFGIIGDIPWVFWVPGEAYVRREFESSPFVRRVYCPNGLFVGTRHTVEDMTLDGSLVVRDEEPYEEREVTDEEFIALRKSFKP